MDSILQPIESIDWGELNEYSIVLRILLSLGIGGIIGLERGIKNQPAGFRTYMLVCLGASLVMMTNQYVCQSLGTGDHQAGSPSNQWNWFFGSRKYFSYQWKPDSWADNSSRAVDGSLCGIGNWNWFL